MRPLKITIEGDYYDSHIYSGCLYLWTIDGTILSLDWNRLLASISIDDRLSLALSCAFFKSDYLYGPHWQDIYKDGEVKPIIISKFERLSDIDFSFTKEEISGTCLKSEVANHLNFPHADIDIYYGHLISSSHEGIQFTSVDGKLKKPINTSRTVNHDISALSISPSNLIIAVAGGGEGMFSINLVDVHASILRADFSSENRINLVSRNYSSKVNWMYKNVASLSDNNISTLATFNLPEKNDRLTKEERVGYFSSAVGQEISTEGVIKDIFDDDGNPNYTISWAERDKICLVDEHNIHVRKYLPWQGLNELESMGKIEIPEGYLRDYTTAKSANFGYILESKEGLSIIQSDGEWYFIPGYPTNWRTFNRSTNYSNQLHVIQDNCIEIYSFNNDYFVNQEKKMAGLWHNPTLSEQKRVTNEYLFE